MKKTLSRKELKELADKIDYDIVTTFKACSNYRALPFATSTIKIHNTMDTNTIYSALFSFVQSRHPVKFSYVDVDDGILYAYFTVMESVEQ